MKNLPFLAKLAIPIKALMNQRYWQFGLLKGPKVLTRLASHSAAFCLALCLSGCAVFSILRERVEHFINPTNSDSTLLPEPLELTLSNIELRPVSTTPTSQILDFGFNPKRPEVFFTIYPDGQIFGWEVETGEAHQWLSLNEKLDTASIHPATGILAVAKGESVWIVDLKTGLKKATLTRLRVRPTSLVIQEDGKAVIIGGADGRVYRWKYIEEEEKATISERERSLERYVGHTNVISALATHPFGRVFFSGDWRGNFYAWLPLDSDPYSGEYDKSLFAGRAYTDTATSFRGATFDSKGISNLMVSNDGNYLLLSGEAGMLELWAIRGFERLAHLKAHDGRIWSVALSADGKEIASVGRDGFVQIFDIIKNPNYSAGSSLEKLKLSPNSKVELREGRKVFFKDPSHLYVFTERGDLVEPVLNRTNSGEGVTEPTPTPIPRAEANDY